MGQGERKGLTKIMTVTMKAARQDLRDDASRYGGDGVVIREMHTEIKEQACGDNKEQADLVAHSVVTGTAIAQFRRVGGQPLTIMPLHRGGKS